MTLSPLDIRRQQFAKAFRGYDPTEVDAFLKQLSEQWETLQDDLRRAQERTRDAEAKLEHYEKVELALQEALESARDTARRAEASAEQKARLIVEQAEFKAEQIVHDAERERYGLRQDVVKLNARQTEVAARLRGFLLSELEVLAQFQGDDPVGFIKLQAADVPTALPRPPAQLAAADPEPSAAAPAPPREASAPPPSAPASGDSEGAAPPPLVAPLTAPPDHAPAPAAAESTPPASPSPPPFETLAPAAPPPAPLETPSDAGPAPPSPAPPLTGAYASADEPSTSEAPDTDEAASSEDSPRAVTGGWDLRSLVTGEERSVAASEAERERIRRILEDLD